MGTGVFGSVYPPLSLLPGKDDLTSSGVELALGNWLPKDTFAPRQQRMMTLKDIERQHIIEILELTGWRVSGEKGAAKLLGLKPTTLEARMKRLGIRRTKN